MGVRDMECANVQIPMKSLKSLRALRKPMCGGAEPPCSAAGPPSQAVIVLVNLFRIVETHHHDNSFITFKSHTPPW